MESKIKTIKRPRRDFETGSINELPRPRRRVTSRIVVVTTCAMHTRVTKFLVMMLDDNMFCFTIAASIKQHFEEL